MTKLLLALTVVALVLIAARIVTGASLSDVLRRTFAPLLCAVRGHRRDGGSVRKTEAGYRARCRRCGIRLAKATRQDAWMPLEASQPLEHGDRDEIPVRREDASAHSVGAGEKRSA